MSRPKRPPSYRFHKARNCAVVTLHGKNYYLGPYGSPESHEKYARLIAEWRVDGSRPMTSAPPSSDGEVTVNEVILRYLDFAAGYYLKHGRSTGELDNICCALKKVKTLYGRTPAAEFSAKSLELVRKAMIEAGWKRTHINRQISRVKRVFRWSSKTELVPAGTYHALLSLEGLKWGRSSAREGAPVTTVDEAHVQKTCEHLCRHVRTMVEVQHLTGMRPQDIRNMRTCDLDMSDDVWVYTPWTHKTEHHGHKRVIAIGPRAQGLLKPFVKVNAPTEYIFTPKEAVADFRTEARRRRKTPLTPSQRNRQPKRSKASRPGNYYKQSAYYHAIMRAAVRAGVPNWHPHQLRHNCATRVRRKYGLEGASAVLGHRFGTVTEIYAEASLERAKLIMRDLG